MSGNLTPCLPRRRWRILRRPVESIRPATPRPQRRDCHGRLLAALLDLAGEDARVIHAEVRPWSSATFVGAQHRVTLCLSGDLAQPHARQLAETLPDWEFSIPGHVVIDLSVDAAGNNGDGAVLLDLIALTIEDW